MMIKNVDDDYDFGDDAVLIMRSNTYQPGNGEAALFKQIASKRRKMDTGQGFLTHFVLSFLTW